MTTTVFLTDEAYHIMCNHAIHYIEGGMKVEGGYEVEMNEQLLAKLLEMSSDVSAVIVRAFSVYREQAFN